MSRASQWLAVSTALACLTAALPAAAMDSILVQTDRAQVLKLPPRATTIVIGNPMIADVAIQKNGSMVVTGKSLRDDEPDCAGFDRAP